MTAVEGDVEPGFERVREAFAANFEHGGDVGAALCVYRHGRKVADLRGGLADAGTGRPWAPDTLQLVYSATKAATATCAHLLAQRGELDLDQPAASYWPEFAAAGKAGIPVRWLLSHRAGLPVIDHPIPLADLLAWDPMAAALAAQRPVWEPGTAHGYHGRTYGWLVGEVIRRVSGRSVGTFFAEEIAGPAGLDFFIGLPAAERGRVSQMVIDDPPGPETVAAIPIEQVPEQFRPLLAAFSDPGSLMNRAFALSVPDIDFNDPVVAGGRDPLEQRDLYRGRAGPALRRADRGGRRRPDPEPGHYRGGGRGAGGRDRSGAAGAHPLRLGVHAPDQRVAAGRARPRSAIRGAAGRSGTPTRRAGSRSATWSATSGRT